MNMHREINRRDEEIADLKNKLTILLRAIADWDAKPTTGKVCK